MSVPQRVPPEAFELAREARDIGLVVTYLQPHPGAGGAAYDVAFWREDGSLWARMTGCSAGVVREMIGAYAEECVHGGRQLERMVG